MLTGLSALCHRVCKSVSKEVSVSETTPGDWGTHTCDYAIKCIFIPETREIILYVV